MQNILSKINSIPDSLKYEIINCLYIGITSNISNEEIIKNIKKTIIKYFKNMNLVVTAAQPIKGLMLNGFQKSLTYVNQKLSKR